MRCAVLHFHIYAVLLSLAAAGSAKKSSGGSKACSHTGFYSKKVVPLCERHFPEESSKNAWVVQFYHPYVKKVHDAKEGYEQLAANPDKLSGAKVGAVDCQQNGEFCAKQGIRDAPTTRIISGSRSIDFEGEHSAEALETFITNSMNRFKEMEEAMKCNVKGLFTDGMKDSALPLCTSSFPPPLEPVPWIVSFYDVGDRNKDKAMRNTLNKIAEKYGNTPPKKVDKKSKKPLKLRVGAIDCSSKANDCVQFGVTSLPTVRFYRTGAEPMDFESFIDSDELKQWADSKLKEMPKPEKVEVLKADMSEDASKPNEDL
jgi:thioredoxin-like negative regulator of GroEL|mmetsp:Transcript_117460/g.184723  ORF Transcript_117460/g.184723 Transcript_117460/m.184723 type:complete len:315 (-) Transcript_117460:114-1058(-)